MKKYISTFFAFFCFLCLALCMDVNTAFSNIPCTVYGKVLRLHVVADSDSEDDQRLKLDVRDELLRVSDKLFCECESVEAALAVAKKNTTFLEDTARAVLKENSCNDDVRVVVGKEDYPRKKYGNYTFPAGEYLSVRVIIGSGEGQNWWCVLFPPLCFAGIDEEEKIMSSNGFSREEIKKLEQETYDGIELFGCRVKLKMTEIFR